MATRLTIVSHAATAATAGSRFPLDEPAGDISFDVRALSRVRSSVAGPELRCRHTAAALGLIPDIHSALADLNTGRWRGLTLTEVAGAEPEGVAAWLADPEAAPHGGESLVALLARVAPWLADQQAVPGHVVAVTHPAVVRAVVLILLDAPEQAFWRIDVPPASMTVLRSDGRRWALRALGQPVPTA